MGTLTANVPPLAEHCSHKLPTSCRLTSTPLCCACYDRRPHSLTYRVYIDGVGFVQRGTRWQSYCWFCKTFWDNRVAAAGLLPSETKIPYDPDQDEFTATWFDWHRGYRMVRDEDGCEERQALLGESLKDADPGQLPRTLEAMQSGEQQFLTGDLARASRSRPEPETTAHVSLEAALDEMLAAAEDQDGDAHGTREHLSDSDRALTREHHDSRRRGSETGHDVTDPMAQQEAQQEVQRDQEGREQTLESAQAAVEAAQEELAVAQERLRRIRRMETTLRNLTRVFGTREDVNSDDYISPITSMFVRTTEWGRQNAERQRVWREQDDQLRAFEELRGLQANAISQGHGFAPIIPSSFSPQHIRDAHSFVAPALSMLVTAAGDSTTDGTASIHGLERIGATTQTQPNPSDHLSSHEAAARPAQDISRRSPTTSTEMLQDQASEISFTTESQLNELLSILPRRENVNMLGRPYLNSFRSSAFEYPQPEHVFAGLDGDGRPEPKATTAMQFQLECKICLQQVADTACLPCGHLSMCQWCADQWVPVKQEDRTRPCDKSVKCPCCRARVKSRVKIYPG